jgi:asparagine synthase (glutamine-hydrolysing)
MSIPQAMTTREGTSKYLLKKAVRGLIPDELIDRKKQGFAVPHEWFESGVGKYARRELASFCKHTDFLDSEAALRVVDRGRASQSWCLLNFALWWREFIAETPRIANFSSAADSTVPNQYKR